jgi:choline kinase
MVPAVILAAGLGRRIAALSNGRPKALLEVNSKSLLEREVEAVAGAGFHQVFVVTGYAAEEIRPVLSRLGGAVSLGERWNAEYATTNNIVSLLAAADVLSDGFCLLNSDIVFDPAILDELAGLKAGNWLVVDGEEPLGAEEMKVATDPAGVVTRISKTLDPASSAGEFIGISRFDAPGAATLLRTARRLVAEGRSDVYYEDAIDACAADLGARAMWTRGRRWTEVDDDVDYRRAQQVAAHLDAVPGGPSA